MSITYNISIGSNSSSSSSSNVSENVYTSWNAAVHAACVIAESLKGKHLSLLRNQDDQRCTASGSIVSHVVHIDSELVKIIIHAHRTGATTTAAKTTV